MMDTIRRVDPTWLRGFTDLVTSEIEGIYEEESSCYSILNSK
jgi:hypothetical protein